MGIAVMSQLLICASRVTDFQIDKIDREAIPLLKHPDSFRTTLGANRQRRLQCFQEGAYQHGKDSATCGPGASLRQRLRQNNHIQQ